jgi:hypothetical protein
VIHPGSLSRSGLNEAASNALLLPSSRRDSGMDVREKTFRKLSTPMGVRSSMPVTRLGSLGAMRHFEEKTGADAYAAEKPVDRSHPHDSARRLQCGNTTLMYPGHCKGWQ